MAIGTVYPWTALVLFYPQNYSSLTEGLEMVSQKVNHPMLQQFVQEASCLLVFVNSEVLKFYCIQI